MARVPAKSALAVTRLEEAGAIIVGKTNMHTLGMGTTGLVSAVGPTRNPWNAAYIPGGSSSGSAVAVATGMCHATLDTDAIGSCRLPAACCGVTGFKGTYGLISITGILDGEPADDAVLLLAHAAVTTRVPGDIGLLLETLAETGRFAAIRGPRTTPKRWRVGVGTNFEADQQVRRAFGGAVAALRGLGHAMVDVELPLDMPPLGDRRAIEARRKSIADDAFAEVDVLLSPTTTTVVPTIEAAAHHPQTLSPANTQWANVFGLPAISVPCGWDANGLPLALQIVGKPWDERTVLDLACQYSSSGMPC
jgi:aspartyl-tRNA(Asn)/glutamyl-tRNA(Gln) amidotransferase subunit A